MLHKVWLKCVTLVIMCPGYNKNHICSGLKRLSIIIAILGNAAILSGQSSCLLPVVSGFSNSTVNGFQMTWDDFNDEAESWQIEFGERGFERDFVPELSNLTDKRYTFNGLLPGRTYEIYIRTACPDNMFSGWNGPYFFRTAIDNNSACDSSLDIEDGNCPNFSIFQIQVSESNNLIIGDECYLDHIDLIIAHEWPADLNIKLRSPDGKVADLSRYSGTGIDNLGVPEQEDCIGSMSFSDWACISIDRADPPYTENYKALDRLNNAFQGTEINGMWALMICDRNQGDPGQVQFAHLEFNALSCQPPTDLKLSRIQPTSAEVCWVSSQLNCQQVRLEYRRIQDPPSESFVDFRDCIEDRYVISELEPNTTYVLTMYTGCGINNESMAACEVTFQTSCAEMLYFESFDQLERCEPSCTLPCPTGSFWRNISNGDRLDWTVNSNGTATSFTGPDNDNTTCFGNYIYTESSLPCGAGERTAFIVSPCLSFTEMADCDLAFDYHTQGKSTSVLSLQRNVNESGWQEIWRSQASSNGQWQHQTLNISNTENHLQLRFVSRFPASEERADLALDNIAIYAADTIALTPYYLDHDNDGFGNPDTLVLLCSNEAPVGYVSNDQDCNDNNPSINPSASEIVCNRVDDNCNGNVDELGSNFIDVTASVNNASCSSVADGSIDLNVNSNLNIVSYQWSNGMSGADISGLEPGIYRCTISASNGCQLLTDSITVIDLYDIEFGFNKEQPSCKGANDGRIELTADSEGAPYEIEWSNGDIGLITDNIGAGNYSVTVTDNASCQSEIHDIELLADTPFQIEIDEKQDVSCLSANDGRIRLANNNPGTPLTFNWSNGRSGMQLDNLSPGLYSVTASSNNGCSVSLDSIEIAEPTAVQILISGIEHVSCFGEESGRIALSIGGGTPPYRYQWSNGTTSPVLTQVAAGQYSVTVSDSNDCTSVRTAIRINQNNPITISLDSLSTLRCPGSENGLISVNLNGGEPPYLYNWSALDGVSGQSETIEALTAGTYSLTVSDRLGCKATSPGYQLQINEEDLNVSLVLLDSILCNGERTATIVAVNNDGSFPLDFNWSAGRNVVRNMFSDTISNLGPGTYNLTLTDSEGCTAESENLLIANPPEIQFLVTNLQNNPCFGDNEGLLAMNVTGGTSPLEIIWSNGMTGNMISGLTNGLYFATIEDANKCEKFVGPIEVTSPQDIVLDIEVQNVVSGNDGSISVFPAGGTAPYTYEWDPPAVNINMPMISGLEDGLYNLTVTDVNGCEKDTSVIVDLSSSAIDLTHQKEPRIQLYPNPTSTCFRVKTASHFELQGMLLLDSKGNQIHNFDLHQDCFDLRSLNLPSGVYLLNLNFKTSRSLKRIVFLK